MKLPLNFLFKILLNVKFAVSHEFIIPCLPKSSYQWLFQKLIDSDFLASPKHLGTLADFPTMVVNSHIAIRQRLEAQWIKSTRDGFELLYSALTIGLLYGANALAAWSIARKHTIAAVQNLSHKLTLWIMIRDTILFNFLLRPWQQVVPYFGQNFLYFLFFLGSEWRTSIAVDAALPQASVDVAAKESLHNIERDKSVIVNQEHRLFY